MTTERKYRTQNKQSKEQLQTFMKVHDHYRGEKPSYVKHQRN